MTDDSSTKNTFIGRQPIYDRALNVYGYELLYRDNTVNAAQFTDGDLATSQVIVNTFMEMGLERLVGSRPAFVNVTHDFFVGQRPLPMSNEQVVFELLETAVVDEPLIAGVRALTARGYRIALDDFEPTPETEPLLALASFVKLDVQALDGERLATLVPQLRSHGVELIAEKVETRAEYEQCRALGFDYFQGYFFSRPDVLHTATPSTNRAVVLNLIGRLQDTETDVRELEKIIAHDVVLSYRMLRYINCATFGLRREIDSIQQAVMLLGLDAVRNWATLILASQLADNKPRELTTIALIRARMCNLLAPARNIDGQQAFTVGLFSLLDAMLDTPMEELLDHVPLATPIKLALLTREGTLGALLDAVIMFEGGEWSQIPGGNDILVDYNSAYLAAIHWADDTVDRLDAA